MEKRDLLIFLQSYLDSSSIDPKIIFMYIALIMAFIFFNDCAITQANAKIYFLQTKISRSATVSYFPVLSPFSSLFGNDITEQGCQALATALGRSELDYLK